MKETTFSLLLFFVSFVLFQTGCEEKQSKKPVAVNTSDREVLTSNDLKRYKKEKTAPSTTYVLQETLLERQILTMGGKELTVRNEAPAVLILTFFQTNCTPCLGTLPYLTDLQKKYPQDLLLLGVLLGAKPNENDLRLYKNEHKAKFFISLSEQNDAFADAMANKLQLPINFTLPLTVVYKNDQYYTHYEGAVPVEMIEYDLKNILE